MDQGV